MPATLTSADCEGPVTRIGRRVVDASIAVGDLTLFFLDMLGWMVTRLPRRLVLIQCMFQIGVESLSVVMITGGFIGMVMAVQSYDQFRFMHLETNLGAVINISLVKELGPVLAATLLPVRVGSSMASELGPMKSTEQIDSLPV